MSSTFPRTIDRRAGAPPPLIRPAAPADADALAALVGGLADGFVHDRTAAATFLASLSAEAFAERLRDARYGYLMAHQGGAPVGTIGIRDGTHLYHLFVARAWQGCGLGRRLLLTARAALVAGGARAVLTVNASEAAVPVYRRWGFEPEGEVIERDGLRFLPMRSHPRVAASSDA